MDLNAAFDKLTEHYGEKFEIRRDVDIAGVTVEAVASVRHQGNVSILGFNTNKTGPAAYEHVFMMKCERFDAAMLERLAKLIDEAEQTYIQPDENHAYTFLSVAVMAKAIDKDAAASLKKYKCRREYSKAGWMLARITVVGESGEGFCNKDGVDFKRLVLKIIK